MVKELSNTIKEQLEEAFSILPNKENLKNQFIDSLGDDDFSEDREIIVGVGNLLDFDFYELETLNSYNNIDDVLFTHKRRCNKCMNSTPCEEYVKIAEEDIVITFTIFTDGHFVELFDEKIVDVINETITVKLNFNSGTYQVIKSPKIEKHGLASISYLGQADVNREGKYRCYVLPEKYFSN